MDNLFYAASLLLAAFVLLIAIRVGLVYAQRPRYKAYWRRQLERPVPSDAIVLVALGDSIMQAIGASQPQRGLAGLVAEQVGQITGRPVVIKNYSLTGGRVGQVLREQVPRVDFAAADLVIVSASANDAVRRTDLEAYAADVEALMAALPPAKTVVADVPGVGARQRYQPLLQAAADRHGQTRASLQEAFARQDSLSGITAGDFFHPNDRGYQIWFAAFERHTAALARRLAGPSTGRH